jgi:hypothetical protein
VGTEEFARIREEVFQGVGLDVLVEVIDITAIPGHVDQVPTAEDTYPVPGMVRFPLDLAEGIIAITLGET